MTPEEAIAEIAAGKPRPVYLVLGEERVLSDRVVSSARANVVDPATAAFNVDVFEAGEQPIARAIGAANTMPMMARRRLVIVRGLDRLERADDDGAAKSKSSPSDLLADYVTSPSPSSVVLLVGGKIDGRRRLANVARKAGIVVSCDPLKAYALPGFVRDEAKRRGHSIGSDIAEAIVDLVGGELGALIDAVERLSLYVGENGRIEEDAVHACVARVRVGSVWGLADAVAAKDRGVALRLLDENFDARDRGLPLLGLLASSMRKTLKLRALLGEGANVDDAAKIAGIPPFRARESAAQARRFRPGELERAIGVLSEADLALKGSKRPPLLVLEEAILRLT